MQYGTIKVYRVNIEIRTIGFQFHHCFYDGCTGEDVLEDIMYGLEEIMVDTPIEKYEFTMEEYDIPEEKLWKNQSPEDYNLDADKLFRSCRWDDIRPVKQWAYYRSSEKNCDCYECSV